MLLENHSKNNVALRACGTMASSLAIFVFLIIAVVANTAGYELFQKFQFTSDGFHYFSALRNFANNWSLWEGPTFEYILGNHSYLSMYLLTPLFWIFDSPYLLAFVNTSSHFLAGIILVLSAQRAIKSPLGNTISWLIGLLYVTSPLVVRGYFSDLYMFQPDFLLAPLLALLFLFGLTDRKLPFLLTATMILVTKEEYIPLFPCFVLLVLHCKSLIQGNWIPGSAPKNQPDAYESNHAAGCMQKRKFIALLICVYLIASLFSLAVLFGFRHLNEINHAARTHFNIAIIFSSASWHAAFKGTFDRVLPLTPILVLTLMIPKYPKACLPIIYIAAFGVGRLLLNQVIYGDMDGTLWSNVLIAPVFFIAIICILGLLSNRVRRSVFEMACFFAIALSLVWSGKQTMETEAANKIRAALEGKIAPHFDIKEVQEIRAKVPLAQAMGYVVLEEYLMGPFMDRSHVADGWLLNKPPELRDRVILSADFLILSKANQLATLLGADTLRFIKLIETKSLVCFMPLK